MMLNFVAKGGTTSVTISSVVMKLWRYQENGTSSLIKIEPI